MPLENPGIIKDLVVSNPAPGDQAAQGDDHIRLIKQNLRSQFPNLEGAVTATAAQLNDTAQLRADANYLGAEVARRLPLTGGTVSGNVVANHFSTPPGGSVNAGRYLLNGVLLLQRGMITMWWGSAESVPVGWQICNGLNGTPDLRDRFVVGAGSAYGLGAAGGHAIHNFPTHGGGAHDHGGTSPGGAHDHGGRVAGTVLNEFNLPPHHHKIAGHGEGGGFIRVDGNIHGTAKDDYILAVGGGASFEDGWRSGVTGAAHGHDHQIPASIEHAHPIPTQPEHAHTVAFDNRPPFTALFYIMFMQAQ